MFNLPLAYMEDNILECINEVIAEEDNYNLLKIHEEAEIKEAIFDMNPTSSAGPNGFGGTFYQKYWDIIKEDVVDMVQSFIKRRMLTKYYAHTCLVLIPIVESLSNFAELRPISLSNF